MANVVVFDVGGTKIASTVVNERGEDLLQGESRKVVTQERAPAEEFLAVMVNEFRALEQQFGDVVAWGAAFPGPYKRLPNGELEVHPRNIPGVRGKSVEAELGKQLPGIQGVVDNDFKLAMWGEYLVGALRGTTSSVGLVHSTGVSSATILNGVMQRGPDNNAGEVGCVIVERNPELARPCDAQDGQAYGHLEAQIRGPMLAEIFFGVDRHDKVAVRDALERATESEKKAIIDHCVPYVADVLTPVLQTVSTGNVLLFGGVVSWLGQPYADALGDEFCRTSETFRDSNGQVSIAQQPHLSPLIGAAEQAFAKVGIPMQLDMV